MICDVRDVSSLITEVSGNVVVNFAIVHRDDVTDPNEYYSTNVEGARVLCEVCEEKGINKIVFTSSVAVEGVVAPGTGEEGAIEPFNEVVTKALAEDVYREWREKDPENRSLIIVRPTVVFGEVTGNAYNLLNQINSVLS